MKEDSDLQPSELGTKEYWQAIYERDRRNFEDHGDVGEIWFGEDSELRILRWLKKTEVSTDTRIVDLGCGNAMLLVELARDGFTNLTGVDYCESAIDLARSVINSQALTCVQLKVVDLTDVTVPLTEYDIAIDKGTYDAISLNPNDGPGKRRQYIKNVASVLRSKGILFITSCNWTEIELIHQLSQEFVCVEKIPTPTFDFGGKTGSIVSSLVFEKLT